MESNKINVLDIVRKERNIYLRYPDEAIFSNLYYVSLSHALRAIDGYVAAGRSEEFIQECKNANKWIVEKSSKAYNIKVINFDSIASLLKNKSNSCDAFFYNFDLQEEGFHFIVEFKNTRKPELLQLLKDETRDGIYRKVKDSVENIRKYVLFGGTQESDKIIKNIHFFIVYNGKNTAATSIMPNSLSRIPTSRGKNGKQNHATRFKKQEPFGKNENEIYQHFGEKLKAMGMKECTEDTFPGNAIPRLKKGEKGSKKIRYFTIFSSQDFGELINSSFFDDWNWGPYLSEEDGNSKNN